MGRLWVESEHLKVGCLNFGPVRGSAIYPTAIFHLETQRSQMRMSSANEIGIQGVSSQATIV